MVALTLHSDAGRLVAVYDPPEGVPAGAAPVGAVVCHPHPLHGGTLDNKVVFTLARCLRQRGLHVLRFNFRGAGGSEGTHDHGQGERSDVAAALDELARRCGPAGAAPGSLLVAGFSFGSWVGLSQGLHDPRVGALLAVAPPVNFYDYSAIAAGALPLAVVYAREDELVPATHVERWLASCSRPPRVTVVERCGHLFHGRLPELRRAVEAWLVQLTGSPE